MPFKKGISPNPKGRPKRGKAKGEFDFNGECRKKGEELFKRLISLSELADYHIPEKLLEGMSPKTISMLMKENLAIGLKATIELIAYGYAKPKQEVGITDTEGNPLELIVRVKTDVK